MSRNQKLMNEGETQPPAWQMERMRKLCKDYAANKERIEELNVRLLDYAQMKERANPQDWPLIDKYASADETARLALLKQVLFFESALVRIGGRTADVLRQLYAERVLWDAVEDGQGKRLSPSTIAREKEKGLRLLCGLYEWKEQDKPKS